LPPESAAQLLDRCAFYTMPNSHILGYSVTGPNAEMERGARRYNWVWYRRIPEGELRKTLTDAQGHVHHYSLAPGQVPGSRREALVKDASHLLPPPFAAAVAAERQPFVQAIFDYEAPRMMRGRLALLGDAAFVVRPHTAMGVAKAAGDAMALRSCLGRAPYADALQDYQGERLPIGAEIAAYGRKLGANLG
jgi:2-polyprenyl-6-methoxyphenol hydroxylase-like FAD-dependent oxidoreductase